MNYITDMSNEVLRTSAILYLFTASVISKDFDVQLVGGSQASEGNVYIQYGRTWGLVCDDGWSRRAAAVICKQLGYHRATRATKLNHFRSSLQEVIVLDDVSCIGYERNLDQCRHKPWLRHNCSPKEAAGVMCKGGSMRTSSNNLYPSVPIFASRVAISAAPATTTNTPSTTTITPSTTTTTPSTTTLANTTPAYSTRLHMVQVTSGLRREQMNLAAAPSKLIYSSPFISTYENSSTDDPSVGSPLAAPLVLRVNSPLQPSTPTGSQVIKSVQLLGGRSSKEGYVKVILTSGVSGTVCSDDWGLFEALVVCRELGLQYKYAERATKSDFFHGSHEEKVVNQIQCTGGEKRLADCTTTLMTASQSCSRPKSIAGVICTNTLPDLIPNITAVIESINIQDRYLGYLPCALEEQCLASTAYTLKEKHPRNWNHISRRLLRFSSSIYNNGTADFRPQQHRSSWEWHSCHMHFHSMDVFSHYDVLDASGNRVAEGHKASFCLEDVQCEEGRRKKYSCDGDQGISVGCADVYKHNIDCQWIDISDMKAGRYVFKLSVNPNYIVPELSFENNAAICDLNYSGHDVKLENCRLSHG